MTKIGKGRSVKHPAFLFLFKVPCGDVLVKEIVPFASHDPGDPDEGISFVFIGDGTRKLLVHDGIFGPVVHDVVDGFLKVVIALFKVLLIHVPDIIIYSVGVLETGIFVITELGILDGEGRDTVPVCHLRQDGTLQLRIVHVQYDVGLELVKYADDLFVIQLQPQAVLLV